MPGCQVVFDRPMEEVRRTMEAASRESEGVEVLPGDISVAVMGPSIAVVTEVLERAVEVFLADGRPFACALTLSEG